MLKYVGAALIGFLLGMLYCYWKAITAVYQKKDLVESGANVYTSVADFYGQLKKI